MKRLVVSEDTHKSSIMQKQHTNKTNELDAERAVAQEERRAAQIARKEAAIRQARQDEYRRAQLESEYEAWLARTDLMEELKESMRVERQERWKQQLIEKVRWILHPTLWLQLAV